MTQCAAVKMIEGATRLALHSDRLLLLSVDTSKPTAEYLLSSMNVVILSSLPITAAGVLLDEESLQEYEAAKRAIMMIDFNVF